MHKRIKLISDFSENYDAFFDVTDTELTFSRKTTDGPNRVEMFTLLQNMGYDVPPFGVIRDIYTQTIEGFAERTPEELQIYLESIWFVVYTDINAHCGDGKLKLNLKEAFEKHPDCFASHWMKNTSDGMGHSVRMLVIGEKTFWLEYRSKDDWRSNAGDVTITSIKVKKSPPSPNIKIPLYAIDFLPNTNYSKKGTMYAVDLNVAPGIKGTPVEELLKPLEIAELIKSAIANLND